MPDSRALKPLTPCRYCVTKKNIENMPPTTRIRATYAPERTRLLNSRIGVIGCCARRSVTTNAVSSRTAATNDVTVPVSPQPSEAARTKP